MVTRFYLRLVLLSFLPICLLPALSVTLEDVMFPGNGHCGLVFHLKHIVLSRGNKQLAE